MENLIIGVIIWGILLAGICGLGYLSKKRNDASDRAFRGEQENNVGN